MHWNLIKAHFYNRMEKRSIQAWTYIIKQCVDVFHIILTIWLVLKNKKIIIKVTHYTMRKRGVLQLALQLKFWITKDICNSLYLYIVNANGQIAWVAKLQFTIYMVQLIAISLQFNYYFVKITHFQLLFNFIIITPMMSCWCH